MLGKCAAAILTIALIATASALGATGIWPERPLTMVVPYGAGGPADIVGRIVASRMSDELGQPVIVENIPGAGGMIGTARVARATPDGYQLLFGAAGVLAQNQSLFKHPLYNSPSDFSPIGLIATAPPILIARKDFPARDLREFIIYAKANQSKIRFGSPGAGSGPHVTCVLLNDATGVSATHISYREVGAAHQDLLAGRIDYMCDFISTALPLIKAGAVKPFATLTGERAPALPDLPTADEQGLSGFDAPGWYAIVAPKAAPESIVRRLNAALNDTLDDPLVRDRLTELGNTVTQRSQRGSEYLGNFIKSEIEKWAVPIRASGISMD